MAALLGATGCSGDSVLATSRGEVVAISASGPAFSKGSTGAGLVAKVTPETATATVGETLHLTALDAENNPISASWSSNNPAVATVSSSGLVSALAPGEAKITAKTRNRSATMSVSVQAGAARVGSVEVTPATGTVETGKSVQLSAAVRDVNGTVLANHPVAWTTSNAGVATVSAGGLVTGVASGSVQITASSEGTSGTAAITVASTASAPSSGSAVNECSAPKAGWIWCDDFETDRLSRYFEFDNAGGAFARAAGVGREGSQGMRARWAAGQVAVGSLKLAFGRTPQSYFRPVDAGTAKYREIYWRMYVRNEPGWIGGGGSKLSRATIFGSSTSWAQAMIGHVWSGGAGDNHLVVDPASGTDEAGNLKTTKYNDFNNLRWLGMAEGTTPLFNSDHVGRWHCVEARVRLNDAGISNGVFEMWTNGVLDARRTGLNWVGNYDAYGINAVFFENYWNAGSPQAQERYFDNLVVSTERIGC